MFRPLNGARILDLTRILAGPFATMLLADLGAEVLKVERPDGGDDTRAMGPHFIQGESLYFASINRGKHSLCLDLTKPEGRALLLELAAQADVVIENFREGVAEKLGCDEKTLREKNPKLIVVGMTAFGRNGPDKGLPAFDLTLQARGGTMGITGEPGHSPVRMGPPMGDLAGGLYAVIAVCSALYQRERTGEGAFVDLSLLDCQVSLLVYAASFYLGAGAVLGPQGSAHAHAFPYQSFSTQDLPIVVAVFTDRFWEPFARVLGRDDLAQDPSLKTHAQRRTRASELVPLIEGILRAKPAHVWLEKFYEAGVPAAPVQGIDGVFKDPQVLARGMIAEVQHPSVGTMRFAGNPLVREEGETTSFPPPPLLGEHTDQSLRSWLSMSEERLQELRKKGVLA